jgi:CPA1 family monovalent cation:H+ antiporter
MLLVTCGGGVLLGWGLARITVWLTLRLEDIPVNVVLQFIVTFGVWILADRIGLSGVLTVVSFAMTAARRAPEITPARIRIPAYAVWDTVVFVLNVLAFVFIGLQVRPILASLEPATRTLYLHVAGTILITVILVRIAWVMTHNVVARWRIRRYGFHPPRPTMPPTIGSGIIISWSGMRGIVSLAAALAFPAHVNGAPFPFRDLIVLTAFAVVLGTLVIQGLTLKPLLRALGLHDDDPVGQEVERARERALLAALATFDGDTSPAAEAVRQEFADHLRQPTADPQAGEARRSRHEDLHQRALAAARQTVFQMREQGDIGDAAFHRLEEEFDWVEMSNGASR